MAKEIAKDKADIDRFDMPLPDDFHAHLRQGALLKASVLGHAGQFARVLLMPNTLPPVASPSRLKAYRSEVDQVLAELPLEKRFEPLYTFKLLPGRKGYDIEALVQKGAIAGKLPFGIDNQCRGWPPFLRRSRRSIECHGRNGTRPLHTWGRSKRSCS